MMPGDLLVTVVPPATLVLYVGWGRGRETWKSAAGDAAFWTGAATLAAVLGCPRAWSISDGLTAAGWAYIAWRLWRDGRKRRPSRVAGVVRNLGHRLTVAPVPAGSPA